MTLLFNVGIIPTAVAVMTGLDDHKTLAQREIAIMRRIFFFLIIIAIFLPLLGEAAILAFIDKLNKTNIKNWPELIGKNLVQNFNFLKYMIQAAFISNGILLLDIGHQLIRWFKIKLHNSLQSDMLNKTPYVDDIPFDLGERQAQSAVYFAMGLFFSGTQPLQTVFTCMFFVMKYHVEKYNLIFVYNKQYDTKGILWKPTLRLMIIVLYIF
jgi:hypothetical protein